MGASEQSSKLKGNVHRVLESSDRIDVFSFVFGRVWNALRLVSSLWARVYSTFVLTDVALVVVSIGIMALRRFDEAKFREEIWGLPVIVLAILVWPSLVLSLKALVDTFDGFLLNRIFHIPWRGFGYPEVSSAQSFGGWSAEGLARLLPNLSYWIIYTFYLVFMFFFIRS